MHTTEEINVLCEGSTPQAVQSAWSTVVIVVKAQYTHTTYLVH